MEKFQTYLKSGLGKTLWIIGGAILLWLLLFGFSMPGWNFGSGSVDKKDVVDDGNVTATVACPPGYSCTPVRQTLQPALKRQVTAMSRQQYTTAWPQAHQPGWKTCLQKHGILNKCRVRGKDVECRQSVRHIAKKCGV